MLYPNYYILAASHCSSTIMAIHRTFLRFSNVLAFIPSKGPGDFVRGFDSEAIKIQRNLVETQACHPSPCQLQDGPADHQKWLTQKIGGVASDVWKVEASLAIMDYKGVYGCFLKWWYPQNTPKSSFFVGKSMVVGGHHFRKSPIFSYKQLGGG